MFNKLVQQSEVFIKLASALNSEELENLELMSNIEGKFREPTQEDREIIMTLLKKSEESLLSLDLNGFAKNFSNLDSYVREILHEAFTPQFYDLISDENMFEWVYSIKNKSDYSDFDSEAAQFVLNDLKSFNSPEKVFT